LGLLALTERLEPLDRLAQLGRLEQPALVQLELLDLLVQPERKGLQARQAQQVLLGQPVGKGRLAKLD
jgi:hypothetical protein